MDEPFVGLFIGDIWVLVVGYPVRLSLFWSIKDSELVN